MKRNSKSNWENYRVSTTVKITWKWKDYDRVRKALLDLEKLGVKLTGINDKTPKESADE